MPVPHTNPHALTVRTEDAPYGCLNRKMSLGYYKIGIVLYHGVPHQIHVWVPHKMSTECRYDRSSTDSRCSTCEHKGKAEAYAKELIEKVGQENAAS